MCSTDFYRTVKEFLIKSMEFILSTRCPAVGARVNSPQNRNEVAQVIVNETQGVRSSYPQIWNHDLHSALTVYLEIVRTVEGCYPMMLERWEFLFSPAEICSSPDSVQTILKKSAIALRSLLLTALQLPAYAEFRGQLAYNVCFHVDRLTQWTTKAKAQDIVTLPEHQFRIQSPWGSLSSHVVLLKTPPKPEVLETEETKEVPEVRAVFGSWSSSSQGSANSTNSNPPFQHLTHLALKKKDPSEISSNTLSQIVLKCSLPEIGYTPLSPDVENGKKDSSDDDLLDEALEERQESNPFGSGADDGVTEDAKVAVFSLRCEKGLRGKLFASPSSSLSQDIHNLKQELQGLKSVKEHLMEKMSGKVLRT